MVQHRCLSLVLVFLVTLGVSLLVPQPAAIAVPPVLNESPVPLSPVISEPISVDRHPPTALGLSTTALPQVIAGLATTCVINAAGQLYCWGAWSGIPEDLGLVAQVSVGYSHTCAVTVDGALRCWGDNEYGKATVPADLGAVSQVSAGGAHTCAVTAGGTLRCWGENRAGQATVPDELGAVSQVSAGYAHTCAVTVGGTLRCWGSNWDGQATVPDELGAVSQVSAGYAHTCAVTAGGTLRCWGGWNGYGEAMVPADLGAVSQVSAGSTHTCAVTVDATLRCWGLNNYGQATVPAELGAVSQVSAGGYHTCAVTVGGTLRCWGENRAGQATVPADLGAVSQVSAGSSHTCAVTTDSMLRCWGANGSGQATVPADLGTVRQVSAGSSHTCAVTVDGAVRCWGNNGDGQATVPADLGAVSQVSAGTYHTCAVTMAGALRCWGSGQATIPRDPLKVRGVAHLTGQVTVHGLGLANIRITDGTRTVTTTVTGAYTLTDVPYGTYVLTPTLAGYTFTPTTRTITVTRDLDGQDFAATLLTFPVTGRVTVDGVALADVVITDGTRNATTDSTGAYTLTDVPYGTHVLTPTLAGYTFTPATRMVTVTEALGDQNFAATLRTFPVTGRVTVDGVGLADVVITDGTRSATTDSTGAYTLTDVPYGTHVLTPTRVGYTFTPATRTITVTEALAGQNFTATLLTFPVTGLVTVDGVGLADVVITDGTRTVTTTVTGAYTLTDMPYGTHVLMPTLAGYTFTPMTRTISVTEALRDQDFAASLQTFPVTGRVTVDGVGLAEVVVTDGTRSATTDSIGAYTLLNVPYGLHVLTPTRAGYTFDPTTRSVTVTAALVGQDFAATGLTFPVTGRVTVEGVGLADVVITDGTRSATTDSTGAYTLVNVPYGPHMLTPTRAGYTFTPATRMVTVTGDLTGQDFLAQAAPMDGARVYLPLVRR